MNYAQLLDSAFRQCSIELKDQVAKAEQTATEYFNSTTDTKEYTDMLTTELILLTTIYNDPSQYTTYHGNTIDMIEAMLHSNSDNAAKQLRRDHGYGDDLGDSAIRIYFGLFRCIPRQGTNKAA